MSTCERHQLYIYEFKWNQLWFHCCSEAPQQFVGSSPLFCACILGCKASIGTQPHKRGAKLACEDNATLR